MGGGSATACGEVQYAPKERQLYEAALRLMKTGDIREATVSDIAAEAGMGKGTVYGYFRSKEELLDAFVKWLGEKAGSELCEAVDSAVGFAGKTDAFIGLVMNMAQELGGHSEARRTLESIFSVMEEAGPRSCELGIPELVGEKLAAAAAAEGLQVRRTDRLYLGMVVTGGLMALGRAVSCGAPRAAAAAAAAKIMICALTAPSLSTALSGSEK